jgi:hypothetical protein
MRVRFRHCDQSIELAQDDLADDVIRASRGDCLNLVSGELDFLRILRDRRVGRSPSHGAAARTRSDASATTTPAMPAIVAADGSGTTLTMPVE